MRSGEFFHRCLFRRVHTWLGRPDVRIDLCLAFARKLLHAVLDPPVGVPAELLDYVPVEKAKKLITV